ncbi:MAG: hypothetical protein J07HX64_02976 [halophilic archaeon J07HX64]|nr:MAG: hypothetical protein J07HX64_02976 [halophilic archaeon J07HX64]
MSPSPPQLPVYSLALRVLLTKQQRGIETDRRL